ncbi:glycosyltransferase [Nocardia terpenica]|uniref:Glycosyltransferase n=1 Tax=Nocardia terpenica TaxID=455432 RepID=A0A6G9YWU2_9NOCA|nr:glycosyltransferase [Nocardia terpenica]QIS17795.1 glycosyltransferase [Nocardia terpenica]
MSITSMWEWIPSWILEVLNFGSHYPEGDEDSLFALGDAWNKAGADIEKLIPHMRSVTDDTQKCYTGDGATAVQKQFATLYDGGDASMQKLAQGLKDLGHYTRNGGTQIESTKIQEAIFAGITAYTIISLIADFPWGELGVPIAAAAGREALTIAAEQGGRALAKEAAAVGMRTLLKQIAKQVVIAGLKGFGMGVAMDVGTQGIEMLEGHRDDGFSLSEAMQTGFEFGVGAMVGAPVGMGASKLLGDAVSPFMNKMISSVVGGAAGGVGMYGAGIAWQVGDQLVHGNFDWNKVDTSFDPQLLIAGAGMGGLHGLKEGIPDLVRGGVNGDSARTAVSAGDSTAVTRPEVTAGDATSAHPSIGDGSHPADTVPARASAPPETSTAPTDSHTSAPDFRAGVTDTQSRPETSTTPAATEGSRPAAVSDTGSRGGSESTPTSDRPTSTTPAGESGSRPTAPAADSSARPGGETGTRPTSADTAASDRGTTAPADRGAATPDRGAGPAGDRGAGAPSDRGAGTPSDRGAGTPSDRGAGAPSDRGAGTPGDRGASRAGASGTGASDPNAKVVAGQQDRPVAPARGGVDARPQTVDVTPESRGAAPDARPAAQTGAPGDAAPGRAPADATPGRAPESTPGGGRGPAGPEGHRPLAPYPDGRGAGEGGRPGAGDGTRPDTRAAQTQSTRGTGDGRREGADTPGAPGITPIDTRPADIRGGETRAGDGRPGEVRAGDGRAGDTRTGDRPGREDHGPSGDGPTDHRPGEGDVQSGGAVRPRDVLDTEAQDAWAERAYDRFRLADNDVSHMADHLADVTRADGSTGFGHDEISRVKDHLFREEHPLTVYDENGKPVGTEMRRYDADADIAEAWMRLSSGRALPEDIVLLEHEIAEAKYYDEHRGASYRDAHVEANKKFDWESNIPGRTGENIEGWSSEHGHIPGVSEGVRDGAGSDVPVRRGGSSVESRTDDQQGGSHRQSGGREDRPAGDQGRREGDDHTPQRRDLDSGGDHSGVGGEHTPVAEPAEVIDGAKSWIADRPGDFRLDYSDSQLHEIVSEGRTLGLGDDTIQDFIKIGSRGDKPVTADALIEQMHNWVDVQDRGYPFKFTGPEDFENFRNDLVDGLREAGIPTDDIAIQGSSLRTPHANDVDLAVFVDQAHFDKMVVDHFDGKVKLKSGEKIPLGDLSHSQLVELSRNILADTNREVYNAHARTFANAIDEGIVNSKSKVSPGLKGVSKAIQEKYPHLNVESVSALVHDGPFDTKPAMRVPDRATGPETENLGGARESAPQPPKQSGGRFVPPEEEPRPTTPSEDHPVVADEHGPAERSVESVVESAKSRIEANAKFRLEYSDAEMRSLVEQGRRLGIDDHTIEEFLKVGSRDAKRIGADELATQMHNYVEVVQERGYPYKFTDATDYENFRRDLIDGLREASIPTDDVVVQGSSLRTPRAGDVDLAVFVGRDEFNQMLIDRFDGRIKLKADAGPIDLRGRTPAELVDLARQIAANESSYNAQAKTFKNAVLNDIISSKLDISKPLKGVAKDMQRLHPDQNVESVSVLVRGGEFDTRPTMKVEHPDAPPVDSQQPSGQRPKQSGGRNIPPEPVEGGKAEDGGKRLRILMMCTEWDPHKGGVVAVNKNLAEGFADAGHEVIVRVGHELTGAEGDGRITVIGPREVDANVDARHQLTSDLDTFPENVDAVIGHSRFSGFAARDVREALYPQAKLVHVVHMVTDALARVQGLEPGKGAERQGIERDLVSTSDISVGVGPTLAEEAGRLAEMGDGNPVIHELIPGVPFEEPVPPPTGETRNVFALGRMGDPQKGAAQAAEMVRALNERGHDVRLTLRGAPPETLAESRAQLSELAGREVDVRPFTVDRGDILGDMREADVVIMPSRAEGFGLVAMEAAGAGVPVVVPDTSGAGRFIGDSTRFPAHIADNSTVRQGFEEEIPVDRWADKLESVLSDPAAAQARALELRQLLSDQNRTWQHAAEGLADVIRGDDGSAPKSTDTQPRPEDPAPKQSGGRYTPPEDSGEKRLRILMMCTEWDPHKGGVVAVNKNLAEGFAEAGHEVFVRVGHEVTGAEGDGRVTVIGTREQDATVDAREQLTSHPEDLPEGIDVVIGHSRFSGFAAREVHDALYPEAKLVHVVHMVTDALARVQERPEVGPVREGYERDLISTSDVAVGVGPTLAEEAGRLAEMENADPRIHELVPGVPFEDHIPLPEGEPQRMLVFGRVDDPQKGALQAAQMIRALNDRGLDVDLTVRGAPPETVAEAREILSAAAGRDVDVRPYTVDRAEILGDMREASVVVMPSRAEGFGLVAMEAAGAGVPVVVPDTSGAGRFIGDTARFPDEFARASTVRQGFEEQVPVDRWVDKLHEVLSDPVAARERAVDLQQRLRDQNLTWRSAAEDLARAVQDSPQRSTPRRTDTRAGETEWRPPTDSRVPERDSAASEHPAKSGAGERDSTEPARPSPEHHDIAGHETPGEARPSIEEAHARYGEQTDAGVAHHGNDPVMAELARRVVPDERYFTADVHVTEDGHARIGDHVYTPEEYGDLLRRTGWDGTEPIRLIGCDAAENGFAARLAEHLGTDVLSSTKSAWTDSRGRVFSADAEPGPDGNPRPASPERRMADPPPGRHPNPGKRGRLRPGHPGRGQARGGPERRPRAGGFGGGEEAEAGRARAGQGETPQIRSRFERCRGTRGDAGSRREQAVAARDSQGTARPHQRRFEVFREVLSPGWPSQEQRCSGRE